MGTKSGSGSGGELAASLFPHPRASFDAANALVALEAAVTHAQGSQSTIGASMHHTLCK